MSKQIAVITSMATAILFSETSSAVSVEARMAAMERRMAQLENKLESTEAENRQLKSYLADVKTQTKLPQPALKAIDDKVFVLENRLDFEKKTAEETAKKVPKIEVSNKGLSFKSADENYKVGLRGYVQSDAHFYVGDTQVVNNGSPISINDNFTIRRARLSLDGTLFKNVDFRLAPDFANSQVRLFDAFIDAHYFSSASLMAGKFRQPVSLERMQTATNLTFIERAFPAQLAPNRDLGVMLHGAFAAPGYKVQYTPQPVFKEFIGYELGVFNGIRDNQAVQNADNEMTGDNNKEVAARLFSHPFMHSGSVLEGLGLGVSGTWGRPNGNTPLAALTSNSGLQPIVSYKTTTASTGETYRIYPQMYWYWKSFGLMGEYLLSSQYLQNNNTPTPKGSRQDNSAWHINVSYMLTGENNSFFGIKPEQVFDPKLGHWGALQLAGRYSELDIDPITLKYTTSAVTRAQAWAIGLNWILNDNFKIMNNFEQTYFAGGGLAGGINRATENVFLSRFQLAF